MAINMDIILKYLKKCKLRLPFKRKTLTNLKIFVEMPFSTVIVFGTIQYYAKFQITVVNLS